MALIQGGEVVQKTVVSLQDIDPRDLEAARSAFDESFYLQTNVDVAEADVDPFEHFMLLGWRQGRDPSREFSVSFYLSANSDVVESGMNPFVHWLFHGQGEGRLGTMIDHTKKTDNEKGSFDLIRSRFDAVFYLEKYPDIAEASVDPFDHYMNLGWREGRDPSAEFSTSFYIVSYPDVMAAGKNPFAHWVLVGEAERRLGRPVANTNTIPAAISPEDDRLAPVKEAFDADYYLSRYLDVAKAGVDPFDHYMAIGWTEGRDPSEEFSTSFYLENNPDISAALKNPFEHWVVDGRSEGRLGRPEASSSKALQRQPGLEALEARFDADYYLAKYPELNAADFDPFAHYMQVGWHERRDPSDEFSTSYYLDFHPDIAEAGVNPFQHWVLHGEEEGRQALSFRSLKAKRDYAPRISAIVPNYNHGAFLSQRLESILLQTYRNIDILILDDCSTDDSKTVIDQYVKAYPDRIRAIINKENSGGVFRQWRRGVEETDGEIVWICESDDFCELDFAEQLVGHFKDDSVSIAFGRIQETDNKGVPREGLDAYRESAEAGVWGSTLVRPAAAWFANGFGVNNVIANVGGCMWRRSRIADDVWRQAQTFSVVGDWFLYIHMAGGGQIAWEPAAVSYFRRHDDSTSWKSFVKPTFYTELERLMLTLRSTWNIPTATVIRFYSKIIEQYAWFDIEKSLGALENYCDLRKLLDQKRTRRHILLSFYGFLPGGGENFPIHLANDLHESGWLVSVLIFETRETNAHMRAALNPAIAVYDAAWVLEYGADRFLKDAGIDLIHSHTIGSEMRFFHQWKIKTPVSYLVTLHGSYEATENVERLIPDITSGVDHFVYTADKNLKPLISLDLPESRLTKLPNAMPVDPTEFGKTRAELGIHPDAVVFTLVARGIVRKGWRASVEAFVALRRKHPGQPMHLLLCGDGEEPDRHQAVYGSDPDITFLGYQSRIHGLYRLTDVAIVPTRFSGESFPLCIIQALQVGVPVVGAGVGEIARMLTTEDGQIGGVIIEAVRDTETFIDNVCDGMEQMLNAKKRSVAANTAAGLGEAYDMSKLVGVYSDIYDKLISTKRAL